MPLEMSPAEAEADRFEAGDDPSRGVSAHRDFAESLADAPPKLLEVQDAAFATASAQPFPFQSIRQAQVHAEKPGANAPIPPAGLLALFEAFPDKTAAQTVFDKTVAAVLLNEDGTPAWVETGPQMVSKDHTTGQRHSSRCVRSTKVLPFIRPSVTVQGDDKQTVHGYLDHGMAVADPSSRQAALDLLAQGIVPEATHLCANDWCISRSHMHVESRMTWMDCGNCPCRGPSGSH